MSRRVLLPLCIVTVAAVVASACGGGASSGGGTQPRTGALTKAELRYGLAPDAHPKVTYQPDVVVVGGGADSVVSATADGTTFTLKADAPHLNDLEVGKVMVLTNQATGRVLSMKRTGAGVVVELVPVELGEVFKDAKLSFNIPIDSNEIGFDPAPQPGGETSAAPAQSPLDTDTTPTTGAPASAPSTSTQSMHSPTGHPAQRVMLMDAPGGLSGGLFGEAFGSYAGATGFAQDKQCGSADQANTPPAQSVLQPYVNTNGPTLSPAISLKSGNWDFEAERQPGQLAFRAAYIAGPLRIGLIFRLYGHLTFSGSDTIVDGHESPSGIHLGGVDRITIGFLGGTSQGQDNLRERIDIPLNLEMLTRQVFIDGIPFVVAAKPKFVIETAFSANNSTLWTCGDYRTQFESTGSSGQPVAKFFNAVRSLLPISGISIGVTGMVVDFDLKFQFGLGVKGAYAGPFATISVAVGATRGSDLGIVNCQSAELLVTGKAGVGFSLSGNLARALTTGSGQAYVRGYTKMASNLQALGNRLRGISQKLTSATELDFDQALYSGTIYRAQKTIPAVPICEGSS